MTGHVVAVEVAPDFSKFGSKMRLGLDQALRNFGPGPNPLAGLERDAVGVGKVLGDSITGGARKAIVALTSVGKVAERTSAEVGASSARAANAMATGYANGAASAGQALDNVAVQQARTASSIAAYHEDAAASMAVAYADASAAASAALLGAFSAPPTPDFDGVAAAGERAGQTAGTAFSGAYTGEVNRGMGQAKALLQQGLGLAAAVGGGFVGTALFKGFQRLTTIEDAKMAMGVILDSKRAADDMMASVLKVVQGTPFSLDQFADAAKTLVAFNVEASKIPGILTSIGEAGAASGRGAEGVASLVNVFGQMSAMGKVSLDQVWQISMSGVKALDILANEWGMTTAAMTEFISTGAVPADRAIAALTKGIAEGSDGIAGKVNALGGTMQALGDTVSGSLANFKTAIARFGAGLMAPIMEALPPLLNAASAALDKVTLRVKELSQAFVDSGPIQAVIGSITKLIEGIDQSAVDAVLARLAQVLPFVIAGFSGLLIQVAGMLPVLSGLVGGVSPITVALIAFAAAIPGVRAGFADFVSKVGPAVVLLGDRLAPVLQDITQMIGGVAPAAFATLGVAVIGLTTGLATLFDLIEPATNFLAEHREIVMGVAAAYGVWAAQAKIAAAYQLATGARAIAAGGVLSAAQVQARQAAVAGAGAGGAANLTGGMLGGALASGESAISKTRASMRGLREEFQMTRAIGGKVDGGVVLGMTRAGAATEMLGSRIRKLRDTTVSGSTAMTAGIAAFAAGAMVASGIMDRWEARSRKIIDSYTDKLPGSRPGDSKKYLDVQTQFESANDLLQKAGALRKRAEEGGLENLTKGVPIVGWATGNLLKGLDGPGGTKDLIDQAERAEKNAEAFEKRARNLQKNYALVAKATDLPTAKIERLAQAAGVDLTKGIEDSADARRAFISDLNAWRKDAEIAGMTMASALKLDPEVVKANASIVQQVGQQVSSAWGSFFDLLQVQGMPVDKGDNRDAYDAESAAERIADALDRVTEAQQNLNEAKREEPESASDRHRLRDLKDAEAKANFEAHGVFKTREAAQAAQDAWKKAKQDLQDYYEEKRESDIKDAQDRRERIADAQDRLDEAQEALRRERAKQARDAEERAAAAASGSGSESDTLPLTGNDVAAFTESKLMAAREFMANIQTAIVQGYDPDLVVQMLSAGPEKAGELLKVLVSQTTTALRDMVNAGQEEANKFTAFAVNLAQKQQMAINEATNPTEKGKARRMQSEVSQAALLDQMIQASGGKGSLADLAAMAGLTPNQALTVATDFGMQEEIAKYGRPADMILRGQTRPGGPGYQPTQWMWAGESGLGGDGPNVQRQFQAWLGADQGRLGALNGARNAGERKMIGADLFRQFLKDVPDAQQALEHFQHTAAELIDSGTINEWTNEIKGWSPEAIVALTAPDLGKIKSDIDSLREGVDAEARFVATVQWGKDQDTQIALEILKNLGISTFWPGAQQTVAPNSGDDQREENRREPFRRASGGIEEPHIQAIERIRYAEPETGGEAYLPRLGHRAKAEGIMQEVAGWYGGHYIPAKEAGKRVKSFASGGYNGVNSTSINNEDPVGQVYRDPDAPFWWPGVDNMYWENGVWYDGAGRKVGTGASPLRGPIHWTPPPGLNITEEMRRWNGRWPTAGARGDYDKWQAGGVSFGSSTGAGPGTFGDAYVKSQQRPANWRYRPRKGGGGDWVNLDTGAVEGWSDGKNGRLYRAGEFHQGVRTPWTMAMNRLQVQLDERGTTKDWQGGTKGVVGRGSLGATQAWNQNVGALFSGGEGTQNEWTRAMHRLAVQGDEDWAAAQRRPTNTGTPGNRPHRPEEGSPGSGVDDDSPYGNDVPSWFAGSGSGPGKWTGNTVGRPAATQMSTGGGRSAVRAMFSDSSISSARAGTAIADIAGSEDALTAGKGGGDTFDESINMYGDIVMHGVGNDVSYRGGAELLRQAKRTRQLTSSPAQHRRRS